MQRKVIAFLQKTYIAGAVEILNSWARPFHAQLMCLELLEDQQQSRMGDVFRIAVCPVLNFRTEVWRFQLYLEKLLFLGIFTALCFCHDKIVFGALRPTISVRPSKLNSDTRAMCCFSDVLRYILSATKALGRKDPKLFHGRGESKDR